ncbi:hypothetical protein T4C_5367 [Trichinella pseudospiralis]|uniref:Uncharacterized protein n=1 Tax=Trichinella pseudospiralis TaxID=6337 RepID=A0A0V1JMX9_TRIPS|nr:hypothetical protein T4C_5367 [Trichinella pseudospiralis]
MLPNSRLDASLNLQIDLLGVCFVSAHSMWTGEHFYPTMFIFRLNHPSCGETLYTVHALTRVCSGLTDLFALFSDQRARTHVRRHQATAQRAAQQVLQDSNEPTAVSTIPAERRSASSGGCFWKTLGIYWDRQNDHLIFSGPGAVSKDDLSC